MRKLLEVLFPSHRSHNAPLQVDTAEQVLAAQKEAQALRLELLERQRQIESLQQEIDRLQTRQQQAQAETAALQLENVFRDLASPASQILTQADLIERQGKTVPAEDILAVARRMVRALERHGVVFEGTIGAQIAYDPDRHTLLQRALAPGQMVTVRFAGVSYRQKIVYKAIVE